MGQFDNINIVTVDTPQAPNSGIQFHDVQSHPAANATNNVGGLDFHSLVSGKKLSDTPVTIPSDVHSNVGGNFSGGAAGDSSRAYQPAPFVPVHPAGETAPPVRVQTVQPAEAAPVRQVPRPETGNAPDEDPKSFADRYKNLAHPAPSDSIDDQVGYLATNGVALGSAIYFNRRNKQNIATGIKERINRLADVTGPENRLALKNENADVLNVVAEKLENAEKQVDAVAIKKPGAFEEVQQVLPSLKAGQPPTVKSFWQVSDVNALTDDELVAANRAEYLRELEGKLTKGFNYQNTITVDAFQSRSRTLEGIASDPEAAAEGLTAPLNRLQVLTDNLYRETITGQQSMIKVGKSDMLKGAGIIFGSYAATRGIDRLIYGGKSQGLFTTATDVGLPLLVFTEMPTWAKVGLMVGGHELVRFLEWKQEKDRDAQKSTDH